MARVARHPRASFAAVLDAEHDEILTWCLDRDPTEDETARLRVLQREIHATALANATVLAALDEFWRRSKP